MPAPRKPIAADTPEAEPVQWFEAPSFDRQSETRYARASPQGGEQGDGIADSYQTLQRGAPGVISYDQKAVAYVMTLK